MKVQALQTLSWVLLLALVAAFSVLVVPVYSEERVRTVLLGIYAGLAGLTVLSAACTMGIDPADQGLLEARRQRTALAAAGAVASAAHGDGGNQNERGDDDDDDDDDDDVDGGHRGDGGDVDNDASQAEAGERPTGTNGTARARLTTTGSGVVNRSNSTDATVFCYVCHVHVDESSIHCRMCNKCVQNFDHHCAWLGQWYVPK